MEMDERVARLEGKLGITKDGAGTGNGVIFSVKIISEDIDAIYEKNNMLDFKLLETNMRLDIVEKKINEIEVSILNIEKELSDNINIRTIAFIKNVIVATASVLTALGIVVATIKYFLN